MIEKSLEKKETIFLYAPLVEEIALEFGIDDQWVLNAMYETFKRSNGYDEGYNAGIDDALSEIDGLSWRVDRLKKD